MTISYEKLLGYKDVYGKYSMSPKNVLARRVGRKAILDTSALLLTYCRKGTHISLPNIIKMFFSYGGQFDIHGYHLVMQRIHTIVREAHGMPLYVLCEEALLDLYTWAAESTDMPEDGNGLGDENSTDLLKLVLLSNDKVLERYSKAQKSVRLQNDRRLLRQLLAERFPQTDLVEIDYGKLLYSQVYKLMQLLNFLETTPAYEKLFNRLLQDFDVKNKEEFFKALGGAVFTALNLNKTGINYLVVEKTPEAIKNFEFLDRLAHSTTEVEQGPADYIFLRDRPLQKMDDLSYQIVFDFFLIKKMYNGLMFKLSGYCNDDKTLLNAPFFGMIRDEFIEGILVYDTMNAVVSVSKTVVVTGNEFKAAKVGREPDFYCRHNDKILLIESKDFFITGEEKRSYDFNIIMNGLSRDGRLQKATLQLATNVMRTLQQKLLLDTAYIPTKVDIYPAVIVHDSLYNCTALNYWTNEWFQDELKKIKAEPEFAGVDITKVRPVTLIDIDTLILYRSHFESGTLNLYDIIEEYQKYVDFKSASDTNHQRAIIPFSEFAADYIKQKGLKPDIKLLSDTYGLSGFIDDEELIFETT